MTWFGVFVSLGALVFIYYKNQSQLRSEENRLADSQGQGRGAAEKPRPASANAPSSFKSLKRGKKSPASQLEGSDEIEKNSLTRAPIRKEITPSLHSPHDSALYPGNFSSPPLIRKKIGRLLSLKEMVIYQEVMGKPKSLKE